MKIKQLYIQYLYKTIISTTVKTLIKSSEMQKGAIPVNT